MSERTERFVVFLLVISILLILPLRVSADSSEYTCLSGITADEIGTKIETFVSEHEDTTAGMAVSVFDQSSVIYHNYFGHSDIANRIAVDQDSVFEWGSATKLLVWVSAMQLWEQEKLDLNADIQTYLPEAFLHNLTYDTPVTMLNLMNHNAGFEDTFVGMATHREDRIQSLEDYLTLVQPQQIFAPGAVTAYSNWGVTLAGFIVEQISGMPFYDYVQKNIFAPLGMSHSALNADLSDNAWVKQRWEELKCYTTETELIPERGKYIIMYPAGMCTSTVGDFAVFGQALLNRHSPLFQNPSTYDAFMTPSAYFGDTDIPLNYHGLWSVRMYDIPVVGHGGNTSGCSSYLLLDLQNRVGMTVMTNQAGEQNYNREMPEYLFGKYQGEPLDFTGYLVSARTVFRGPLKLQQLLNTIRITPEDTAKGLCVLSESNGVQKLTQPYGDFLVKPPAELIALYLPLLCWLAGLAFCFVNVIARGITWSIRKICRRAAKYPPKKWADIACVLQLLPLIPVIPAVASMFRFNMWTLWQLRLVFGAFLVWAVVYTFLAVYGIREMVIRKKADWYCAMVVFSLVTYVFNIFYWELGAFWIL